MDQYRIRPGHNFKMPDGTEKTGGELIELPSDVALAHPHAVERIEPPAAAETQPTTL